MQEQDAVKIERVRAIHVGGEWDYRGALGEATMTRPAHIYPELLARELSLLNTKRAGGPPYSITGHFLAIDADQGASGICGPIAAEEVSLIRRYFAELLIGENPHAVERIWDKMYRYAIHGRKGLLMMALSKVDLALWDLKGKLLDAPVYLLLGGPSRSKIRAYASMIGYSVEPQQVIARTQAALEAGYTALKWYLPCAPKDGEAGLQQNLAVIRAAREAAGPDADLMFDAWNSWNAPYTLRLVEMAAEYHPYWFEEPVMPDMIAQYAELRAAVRSVSIAGGQHEYTRWGFKSLLDAKAVHILQPDVTWAGGLSEMTKICALASAAGIPVVPHNGGPASTHLIASQTLSACPMQEWALQIGAMNSVFYKHKLTPIDGYISLPSAVGLGMDLADKGLETLNEQVLST